MVNNAVVSHNSVNELYYLEEVDSTNTWAKANLDKFGPVGAVYTTSQQKKQHMLFFSQSI